VYAHEQKREDFTQQIEYQTLLRGGQRAIAPHGAEVPAAQLPYTLASKLGMLLSLADAVLNRYGTAPRLSLIQEKYTLPSMLARAEED
jgi:hypothetical protein